MTVVSRRIRSTPVRSCTETWGFIVDLLAPDDTSARRELESVSGIACSLISEESWEKDPCVIHGVGPRVRIRCLHDDKAISGDDSSENPLGHNPTDGNWNLSLPCPEEDFLWVSRAIEAKSSRIQVRKCGENVDGETRSQEEQKSAEIDLEAFFE